MALLGSLAFSAFRNMNPPAGETGSGALPLGLREPQNREEEAELQNRAKLVLRGMINAAKADGQIDQTEVRRILAKIEQLGAETDAREFVLEEMGKPENLEDLLKEVSSPEVGAQLYAASLLAIEVDTPMERAYLERLARGAGLGETAVLRIHETLGIP